MDSIENRQRCILSIFTGLSEPEIKRNPQSALMAETIRIALYSLVMENKGEPVNSTLLSNWVNRKIRSILPGMKNRTEYHETLEEGILNQKEMGEILDAEGGYLPASPFFLELDDKFLLISGIPTVVLKRMGYKISIDGMKRIVKKEDADTSTLRISPESFFKAESTIERILMSSPSSSMQPLPFKYIELIDNGHVWTDLEKHPSYWQVSETERLFLVKDSNDEKYILRRCQRKEEKWIITDEKKECVMADYHYHQIPEREWDTCLREFAYNSLNPFTLHCIEGLIHVTLKLPRDAWVALNLIGEYIGNKTILIDEKDKKNLNKVMKTYYLEVG